MYGPIGSSQKPVYMPLMASPWKRNEAYREIPPVSMYTVACREFKKGADVKETARRTQHPVPVVQAWYESFKASEDSHLTVCGTDCSACSCYKTMCQGCSQCEGKVFHAPEGKACPIYACVTGEKVLKHCGECEKVPCEIWMNTRDPRYSDEEFGENVRARIQALKSRS